MAAAQRKQEGRISKIKRRSFNNARRVGLVIEKPQAWLSYRSDKQGLVLYTNSQYEK